MKRVLLAIAVAGAVFTVAEAHAQFILSGPDGSIGISNGNGTYTYIYPQRLQPGANWAQPGTTTLTPWGTTWVGMDNQVHGNFVDPNTGDIHLRSRRTSNGSRPVGPPIRRR